MIIEKLAAEWNSSGVKEGDVLLLHSNIRRLGIRYFRNGQKLKLRDILESFLCAVGPTGTLIFPLFNFGFTKGIPFDFRHSPSKMGAITEEARLYPGVVRTGHPIYSFAVLGAESESFRGVDNFSGYGADSPFAILRKLNGKIAVLDLPDQNSMTFYHHIEEMHQVPYRYHKKFSGEYINENGGKEYRTYGLFVRDLQKKVLTHVDPAGELMWEKGLYTGCRPNVGFGLRVISANDMFEFVSDIIVSGMAEGLLYRIGQ